MDRLVDLATVLRSKNSGPFEVTLDVLFDNEAAYRRVVDGKIITKAVISRLYAIPESSITQLVEYDKGLGVKVTFLRQISSGTAGDRDVYGAQQHGPLMDLMVK